MSEILKLEEDANILLKKLQVLVNDLSNNLSKGKTEKALNDGYECINEIQNIIEQIKQKQKQKDNYMQNNLFEIIGDLNQKKEKLDKIQNEYVINKSNDLIDSYCSTNQEEKNLNNIFGQKNSNYESDGDGDGNNNNIEQNTEKENYDDEIFQVNNDITELSEEYINNDNCIFLLKRRINKCCVKIRNKIRNISPANKYLIILIILIIILGFSIYGLFCLFTYDSKQD